MPARQPETEIGTTPVAVLARLPFEMCLTDGSDVWWVDELIVSAPDDAEGCELATLRDGRRAILHAERATRVVIYVEKRRMVT